MRTNPFPATVHTVLFLKSFLIQHSIAKTVQETRIQIGLRKRHRSSCAPAVARAHKDLCLLWVDCVHLFSAVKGLLITLLTHWRRAASGYQSRVSAHLECVNVKIKTAAHPLLHSCYVYVIVCNWAVCDWAFLSVIFKNCHNKIVIRLKNTLIVYV